MKLYKISLALMLGIGTLTSCSDKLELANPNEPSTGTFGNSVGDLEEAVIACYHHMRMEGTYARVGYTIDAVRAEDMWNPQNAWYLEADHWNVTPTNEAMDQWIYRDWYFVVNISNYVITKCEENYETLTDALKKIKGQALFARGLAYYNLACYYQNPPLILNYNDYSNEAGLHPANKEEGDESEFAQFDRVMDQVEKDLAEAMTLLPTRDAGGEWAKGRATSGAAAGIYARALMQRHKYSEALTVLKDILNSTEGGNQKYGTYKLMDNYGDNFQEGSYENNAESLFEIQYLDNGSQGSVDEWTQVNISKDASQGNALEANCGPISKGGWGDLAAAPWLYNLFKKERTTDMPSSLDPRLYWTIGSYEQEWEGYANGNVCYGEPMTEDDPVMMRPDEGGLPIAKHTNLRTNLYTSVVQNLRCGINIRIMRYSDVLLRAAECENEVNGPTAQAIEWINVVRRRAHLKDLALADFNNADKLFEQIANVERPKEFGCEYGRGFDLLRWGFFYNQGRLQQMKEHSVYILSKDPARLKENVQYGGTGVLSSFDFYNSGHEFLPIFQTALNDNPNLVGNSANYSKDNSYYFSKNGWTVHPVVDLSK